MKKKIPTEQEIAKKHGVSLKYIIRQAEIGSTVEREHVTTHEEAYGIALQHIAEFPNYYKHLLKMEKQLKSQWQDGKKSVKEEKEEVRYCHLCKKEETKPECSYGPSAWEMYTSKLNIEEDHKEIASGKIKDHEGYMANLELDQMERSIEMLRKVIRKSNQQLPAWVQSKITRAADFVDTAAEYLSSDEKLDEGLIRKIIDKAKGRKEVGRTASGGRIYQSTRPSKTKIVYSGNNKSKVTTKKSSSDDPWLQGAKASGGAELKAHYRQLRGESKSFSDFMTEAKSVSFEIGDDHRSIQRQAKIRNLAKGTTNPGEKEAAKRKLKGPSLPIKEGSAWTKKQGQNKNGGLNEKGRKSYERENPGSDLKAPSKKVGNPRRASFCARMKGMKAKLTSSETAKDPNSRINKSLRAWNC